MWLVAERDLEAQYFNLALLPIRTTNDECSTSALFATNRCYVLGGLSALNLIRKQKMVTKKEWSEFRSTGLVLIVNQILHIFGWALVFEIENDEIKNVYPSRVKFRGFDNKSTDEAYKKLSKYMLDNATELNDEAQS